MVDYRNDPAAYVVADTKAGLERMRRTAAAAGCRVIAALPVAESAGLLAEAVPGAPVLVELEDEPAMEGAIPLLDWLLQEARDVGRRAVVSAPVGLIDLVAASGHAGIAHLCEADEAERVAAIALAIAPPAPRLRDEGEAERPRVLQRTPDYAPEPAGPDDLHFVRAILRARRLRGEHFPADLFADPAGEILLDLWGARLERKRVTVSSLCVAAAVPPTTALRWIGLLAERGLVVRVADLMDRRRVYIELSNTTAQALGGWLRQVRRLASEAL
jgi:hypothetical protein